MVRDSKKSMAMPLDHSAIWLGPYSFKLKAMGPTLLQNKRHGFISLFKKKKIIFVKKLGDIKILKSFFSSYELYDELNVNIYSPDSAVILQIQPKRKEKEIGKQTLM